MDFVFIIMLLAWLGTKILPEGKTQDFAGLGVAFFGFIYFILNNAPPFLYVLVLILAGVSIHSFSRTRNWKNEVIH